MKTGNVAAIEGISKMLYSVIGIFFIIFNFVSSMDCPGCNVYNNLIESFNDTAVTDFGLSESGNISKLMDCVVICANDIRCRSYRYNARTETCSTYGVGYSLPEKTLNTVTAEAGSRLYAMCGTGGSFGSSCFSNADCSFANSVCSNGRCSCTAGLSYNVLTGECLARCQEYGDMFELYPDSDVRYYNTKVTSASTQELCRRKCRLESSFTCINVEYTHTNLECILCVEAWVDLASSSKRVGVVPDWVVYYRHCAY